MSEATALIVGFPQFQHYYSPDLDISKPIEFNRKYSLRSCVTTEIEEETSRRCKCGMYLLIRPKFDGSLSDIEKKIAKEEPGGV